MLFTRVARAGVFLGMLLALPSAASAESLSQALASAYVNNPQIVSALLSVKISAEDIALRQAGTRPTIGLTSDLSVNYATASVVGGPGRAGYSASVGVSYRHTLFDNLQTDLQIQQARAFSEVAQEALRNAEQNVLLQAATAYLNVVRDTQLVQLREENVQFLQAQVASANARLEVGAGTRIEVSSAEAGLAQAVAAYRSAIANLQTSRASYERWVGHAPNNLSLDFRFPGILPASLDQAIVMAETEHPAILSAMAQIRAAQFGAEAAKAAFGPTLDLIGSIGGDISGPTTPPAASGSGSASVRLSLSIPIYAGGALGATVRQANLRQIQSEVDAWSARDEIRASAISAWAGVQNAAAQITSAEAAVAANRQVLQGFIDQRDVGEGTTLDVLNARSDLTSAEEGLIIAQASRLIASFTLAAATGKLSARDLNLPVEIRTGEGYIQSVQDIWQELRAVPY